MIVPDAVGHLELELAAVEVADEVVEVAIGAPLTVVVNTEVFVDVTVVVFAPRRLGAAAYIMPKPMRKATTIEMTWMLVLTPEPFIIASGGD